MGMWRNGRRARFRSVCPKGRGGSTPPIPTSVWVVPARGERGPGPLVISAPGAEPPDAPRANGWAGSWCRALTHAPWPASLRSAALARQASLRRHRSAPHSACLAPRPLSHAWLRTPHPLNPLLAPRSAPHPACLTRAPRSRMPGLRAPAPHLTLRASPAPHTVRPSLSRPLPPPRCTPPCSAPATRTRGPAPACLAPRPSPRTPGPTPHPAPVCRAPLPPHPSPPQPSALACWLRVPRPVPRPSPRPPRLTSRAPPASRTPHPPTSRTARPPAPPHRRTPRTSCLRASPPRHSPRDSLGSGLEVPCLCLLGWGMGTVRGGGGYARG
jgi:hypothetical protein